MIPGIECCLRCGQKITRHETMLELNNRTNKYSLPGSVPTAQSQGCFSFHAACAVEQIVEDNSKPLDKLKPFTVHIDAPISGERNDFLEHVLALNVKDAVAKAMRSMCIKQEIDEDEMRECVEILDVFAGHVESLWDRFEDEPPKKF